MKVLHFIPQFNAVSASSALQYKLALIKSQAECADVHILTSQPPTEQLGNVVQHTYSPLKSLLSCGRSLFVKLLNNIHPDVVHIHSCWNIHAFILQMCCIKSNTPVIISTDKQLEPWHTLDGYWLCKLPKLVAYQRYMLRRADALHAVCEQELADIKRFSWHPRLKSRQPINNKVEVVPVVGWHDPQLLREMTDRMMRLYQKVIDSNPFMLMSDADRHAEDALLHAGVCYGRLDAVMAESDMNHLKSYDDKAWRRLLLHAADEKILDLVLTGARQNNLPVSPFSQSKIVRFERKLRPTMSEEDIANNAKVKKIKADDELNDVEKKVCTAIIITILKLKCGNIHRSDLAVLYATLRFNAYNEAKVWRKMQSLKVDKSAARLLQMLGERYALEEGFMFAEPLSDKGTERLRTLLYKSNIQ